MTLCFPGDPRRYLTIGIKSPLDGQDATLVAQAEVDALTLEELVLLSESAVAINEQKAFGTRLNFAPA